MSLADRESRLPDDAETDVKYVQACFRRLSDEARPLVERGILPRATYELPDGTPMVPDDHEALLEEADGQSDAVAARFRERFIVAGGDPSEVDEEHAAWLSGGYGRACTARRRRR